LLFNHFCAVQTALTFERVISSISTSSHHSLYPIRCSWSIYVCENGRSFRYVPQSPVVINGIHHVVYLSFCYPPRNCFQNQNGIKRLSVGYTVCSSAVAMTAGAVFGSISSTVITLLCCHIIGRPRTIYISEHSGRGSTRGTARVSCCGNRVYINSTTDEYFSEFGTTGHSTSRTNGMRYNSFHGLGAYWDAGVLVGVFTSHSHNNLTTNSSSYSTTIRM
jgi:hypothetical protein